MQWSVGLALAAKAYVIAVVVLCECFSAAWMAPPGLFVCLNGACLKLEG